MEAVSVVRQELERRGRQILVVEGEVVLITREGGVEAQAVRAS
jgi:hypothetical protein